MRRAVRPARTHALLHATVETATCGILPPLYTSDAAAALSSATGTPVRYSDRRRVETLLDACAKDGYRVQDLLVALVQSRIFTGRG